MKEYCEKNNEKMKEYYVAKLYCTRDKKTGWEIDADMTTSEESIEFAEDASEDDIKSAIVDAGYIDKDMNLWFEDYDYWIQHQDNDTLYVRNECTGEYLFTISTFDGRPTED